MTNRWGSVIHLFVVASVGFFVTGCGVDPGSNRTSAGGSDAAKSSAATAADTTAPARLPVANAIDLSKLPPVESAKYTIRTPSRLEGVASGKASSLLEHYRTALEKHDWKLSSPLATGQVTEDSASALLQKGNESVFLSVIPNVDPKAKRDERLFSVGYLGSCDSSKLPRLPGAEKGYASTISTVYFTDMKVTATAASVRTMLQADGWQPFIRPYASKLQLPNLVREEYRKQGNSLRVLISPAARARDTANASRSSVEYVIGAIGHQLPAPSDAKDVQFDDAMRLMRCSIPRDLEAAANYYLETMPTIGYEAPRNFPVNEYKTDIVCKAKARAAIMIELTYEGLSTRAELHCVSAEDRKQENQEAKMP